MLFNSIPFAAFFIIVTTLYFAIPHKFRWMLLLSASCFFYMRFVPVYILILGFTIIIDYVAGILIEQSSGRKRKLLLVLSLAANIGVLAVFKYYNFLNEALSLLLHSFNLSIALPALTILLPIGLSFHTFQAMSYTIEVYRGRQQAERHFGIYALYVMFYPQLVAGPIERPQNLLHQFREKHTVDYDRITSGLKLMGWGLFKKIVIADRLAILVDSVYNDPLHHNGLSFIIATICFSFQIFCDFSGYTDMAIGIARVIGFKLMRNFERPYLSRSVKEFWTRWHISLSTWFKDYLYIPLGGNKVTRLRWFLNILIVFLISGLWHGANLTFIVWGAVHGFYIIAGSLTRPAREYLSKRARLNKFPVLTAIFETAWTFLLVSFAWIFFRAKSVSEAFYVIRSIVTTTWQDIDTLLAHKKSNINLGVIGADLWILTSLLGFLVVIQIIEKNHNLPQWINSQPAYRRWALYYIFLLATVILGVSGTNQFIYFQF